MNNIIDLNNYSTNHISPNNGPKIVFFSGGSALKEATKDLTSFTHNSAYLVTTFDSGGSSAVLRNAFNMPAVGDIRSRILALADESMPMVKDMCALFSYRLPDSLDESVLMDEFLSLINGTHSLINNLPSEQQSLIVKNLKWLYNNLNANISLKGANVGNLFLASRYLQFNNKLSPVIDEFSDLLKAKGVVKPIVEDSLHLLVKLFDDTLLYGQHAFTGKEKPKIKSPIKDICFFKDESKLPITANTNQDALKTISTADVIFYPMGSLYSSIIANLMPSNVALTIQEVDCLKIFIPNLGVDPESVGLSLQDQIIKIIDILTNKDYALTPKVLTHILVDTKNGDYPSGIPYDWLNNMNIKILDYPFVTSQSKPLACDYAISKAIQLCSSLAVK